METSFYRRARDIIKKVPQGKVATYGQVAALAGNHRAARQIAWVLHSSSSEDNLPWHRIINTQGRISLRPGWGYEEQKALLLREGVTFDRNDRVDLKRYLWHPSIGERC